MAKKIWGVLIIAFIIVLIGLGILLYTTYEPSGKMVNGFWNPATQECWVSENQPPGESFPTGDESMFASCCFNNEGDQVDCNNPENILGAGLTQAIYGAGGAPGLPGIFAVSHIITLSNDGSVPIDNIWIDSAVWIPSHIELSSAYNQVIGSGSVYAGSVPIGNSRSFSSGVIDLTQIAGPIGSPNIYDLTLIAKATAYSGQLTSSQQVEGQITVEQEAIGFSISINWAA